jgi:hypothetical protein
VRRAAGPVRVGARTLDARGTFIVPRNQPASGFARNLLDAQRPDGRGLRAPPDRSCARRRRPDEIYDLTAWSQSLLWGRRGDPRGPRHRRGGRSGHRGAGHDAARAASCHGGLSASGGTSTAAAVAEALHEGVRVRAAGAPSQLGGRRYPIGTAIVRTAEKTTPTCPGG